MGPRLEDVGVAFPYDPRPGQSDLVDDVRRAVRSGGHLVAEAPTGLGKTVAVLVPAVEHALQEDRRVLHLTRTHAQQEQVVRELGAISEASGIDLSCAPLQGRRHLCSLLHDEPALREADARELGMLCRDRQEATTRRHPRPAGEDGCRHFAGWLDRPDVLLDWAQENQPTAEALADEGRARTICPYEGVRQLASQATVTCAPYIYLIHPGLRSTLLDWLGVRLSDLVVVVDEAHNLPGHARDLLSETLTATTLERATSEAEEHRDPEIFDGVHAAEFVRLLGIEVEEMANRLVSDRDALLPPDELRAALMTRYSATDVALRRGFDELLAVGEAIREAKRRAGDLPRSYLHRVGSFLSSWFADARARVRVVRGPPNPALEVATLDPREALEVLHEVHASVHVSGTIAGLDAHREAIGLPKARIRRLPSPFPDAHLDLSYVPDVTTRHRDLAADPGMVDRLVDHVASILDAVPRNAIVAFPSFALLDRFAEAGLEADLVEAPDMAQAELHARLSEFRRTEAGRVLAVAGGRLLEGIDLPGDALEVVVCVGIPYPPPSAVQRALKRYHDARSGRGFERAVHLPAAQRLRQTVGRLIRRPGDRGAAVVLDERATRFRDLLPGLEATRDPVSRLCGFFDEPSGEGG